MLRTVSAFLCAAGLIRSASAQAVTPWMRAHPEVSWKYIAGWEERHQWLTPRRQGLLAFDRERFDAAAAALAAALAEGAEDGVVFYELGYCRELQGRPEEALALYGRAAEWYVRNDPGHAYLLNSAYRRALILEELSRAEEALAEYRALLAVRSVPGAVSVRAAVLASALGDRDVALSWLGEVPADDPAFASASTLRAAILLELGNLEGSARALEAAGETAAAVLISGRLAAARGETGEALSCYEQALKLDPDFRPARIAAANQAYVSGDLARAGKHFANLAAAEPGFARWPYNLGVILREMGEEAAAEAELARALALDPTLPDPVAKREPGISPSELLKRGDLIGAEELCRRRLETDPFQPAVRVVLARALQGQGRVGEALLECQRAIRQDPELAVAHLNLGLLEMNRGNDRAAARALRSFLRIAPDSPQANLARRELRRLRGW